VKEQKEQLKKELDGKISRAESSETQMKKDLKSLTQWRKQAGEASAGRIILGIFMFGLSEIGYGVYRADLDKRIAAKEKQIAVVQSTLKELDADKKTFDETLKVKIKELKDRKRRVEELSKALEVTEESIIS
jgi:hypothetical protein